MCKCRSHGTFPLVGLQSSHLNICYYHQDPHQRPLRPGSRLRFCSDRCALLLIEAWHLPRRPGIGRALKRHPFSGLVDSAGSEHDGALTLSGAPFKGLGPGPSLRTLLQTTIRTMRLPDFQAGLFPVRSPLLGESLQTCLQPNGFKRNLRSKTRWFTGLCNSHQVSHFATFFIDARAEISVAESFSYSKDVHANTTQKGQGMCTNFVQLSLARFAPGFVVRQVNETRCPKAPRTSTREGKAEGKRPRPQPTESQLY
ncbi:hypothetical protein RHMOL_RhmolUnG0009700 [Rhododendron molle]|nr:hypothetical protein RHMOL_RhmolUnG0009700 [Rhododendron molle]